MKKIIALTLLLALLMSIISCGKAPLAATQEATATVATKEDNKTSNKKPFVSKVAKPLTMEELNSIPVANSEMSEEELRKLCVDFMHLQLTFPWQPNKSVRFTSGGTEYTVNAGTVYGGHSYVASTYSNLYKVMHYYDEETGMMDTEKMGGAYGQIMGNQCSSNSFWGWARVVNTIKYDGTSGMTVKNGCLRVGPYTYDDNLDEYIYKIPTAEICAQNGESIMYQSYAQIKMADGIVQFGSTAGHVQMATENAVVVYTNGAIDPEQSYVMFQDQQTQRMTENQSNHLPIHIMAGVSHKITFKDLYKGGYLPFTFAEFLGLDPVEKGTASFSFTGDTITLEQLGEATVESNYAISDLTIIVRDKDGKVLDEPFLRHGLQGTPLASHKLTLKQMGYFSTTFSKYAGDGNTIEIQMRIGNGEIHTVYSGKLVK